MRIELFKQLRECLIKLYTTSEGAKRICEEAKVDWAVVNSQWALREIWHAVLKEAEKCELVDNLLAVVWGEYSENQTLKEIRDAYYRSMQINLNRFEADSKELLAAKPLLPSVRPDPLQKSEEELVRWYFQVLKPDQQSLLLTVALFQEMSRNKIMDVVFDMEQILAQ